MITSMLNINRIDLPDKLLLVPFFPDLKLLNELRRTCLKRRQILLSDIMIFKSYSIITGFCGYPGILTIMEFVKDIRSKKIVFLGTAGCLREDFKGPKLISVTKIFADSILSSVFKENSYKMSSVVLPGDIEGVGVTVDIIQRETPLWISKQKKNGLDFVEMEIFPIASYLSRGFEAYVIFTDLVGSGGIIPFKDKKMIKEIFKEKINILKVS